MRLKPLEQRNNHIAYLAEQLKKERKEKKDEIQHSNQ